MGAILASLLIRPRPAPTHVNKFNLPLPPVIHKVITAEEIGNKDVLVIGDVHGCLEELRELIESVGSLRDNLMLIFCGDIINKGPFNLETLRFVRSLHNCHVVRGNHEEHILKHCFDIKSDPRAAVNLSPKYQWVTDLREEEVDYLTDLPYTISLPSLNAIIVHAGLYPWVPLQRQQLQDMVFLRCIADPDGQRPRASKHFGDGLSWASCWTGPEHVYFGHDARRGLQRFPLATGLDTGCVYGGSLTAVFLTGSKRFVIVKAKRTHRKPNEPVPGVG